MNSGRWIRWATAWAPLLALVACGGGAVGDSVDTSTPTAALDASQSTAQSLVATARAGASALLPGGAVSGSVVVGQPSVTVSGDTVLIDSGTLHTDYAAGWLELDYSGWTYDAGPASPAPAPSPSPGSPATARRSRSRRTAIRWRSPCSA